MHVLVVVAHPNQDSFTMAIQRAATASLQSTGHVVTVLDLYEMGFQPAMTDSEHLAYESPDPVLDPLVITSIAAIRAAEMLVFIYPTWWSGLPAMLKGWLEKCMVPGVAFVFDTDQKVRPGLGKVRRIVGISTYGSPRNYVRLINDNGRRTLLRALRLNTGMRTRTTWLGLYAIDASTQEQRQLFISQVEQKMAKL
jgi:NAD(P)H dehydrogenase (quinone)